MTPTKTACGATPTARTVAIKRCLTVICLAAAASTFGCGKPPSAQEKAEQAAIERHNHDFQDQKAQWKEIEKMRNQSWEETPAGPSTKEAIKFIVEKLQSGKVPDLEDANHRLDFQMNPFATNYPISRTFSISMKSGLFANHYTVVKDSANEQWKLQRAWRTDAQGNLVKTYSLDNL